MKKFLHQYNKILEQDDAETNDTEIEFETPVEEPATESEPEVQTMSPESEVLLVRLIKKALVTEIDSNDVDSINELSDINEINAKSSLQTLINIMKKYTTDIDISS